MTEPLLRTWPGRRGDGETAYVIALAASRADVPEARQVSHDRVIAMTGEHRAGPVHWIELSRNDGLEKLEEVGLDFDPAAAEFLHAHPESLVVLAMVRTDAPWRWTA